MPDNEETNKEEGKKDNSRRRMVVEEVGVEKVEPEEIESSQEELEKESSTPENVGVEEVTPVTEIKEKVEELKDITEEIHEKVEESEEVQEEIAKAVEENEELMAPVQAPSVSPFLVIIPGILLLGALLGGIVFYQKMMNVDEQNPEATATPTVLESVTPSPTATTSATTSLTKYSIVVQNGSGTPGEAGRVQTLVEKAGFKVGSTSNADNYNYTKSVVKAKAGVEKDFLDKLVETLGASYTVDKTQTLPASSKDDVQVIVGSTKTSN